MSDFLPLAQSLTVALKAIQMYTSAHPRAQESLVVAHSALDRWLSSQDQLQFVVSGSKAFVDGQVQDIRNPHAAALVKLVSERGVSGFVFERGATSEELLVFLQGLALKPAKLEEQGGFEALLSASHVRHIRVSQVRYQEVRGDGTTPEEDPPAPVSAAPAAPDQLVKLIKEALMAALTKGTVPPLPTPGPEEGPGFLRGFHPADLSGLGPMGLELGLGEDMPTQSQLGTLRQVLMGLSPEVQLGLLAGLSSLPERPAGLALGLKALAGEILAVATSTLLAKGASWLHLRGPLQDILRPLADRESLVRALASHLRASGQDASQAEAILRNLEWDALSLEAKLLKVFEGGVLFELSLDQRLALLRELLDLRRFDDFLRIQDVLLETLRGERTDLRMMAIQTLAGMCRWAQDPGLPPDAEGPLAQGLRAHFAWEPEPPIHRWTTEGIEALLSALVHRGAFSLVLSDIHELEGLCAFLEEQHPWRREQLARLRAALLRPQLLDTAVDHALRLDREHMSQDMHPYLEFLGDPMARHLVDRLGAEGDRARRGRLVEVLRSMGPATLPALMEALGASTWYLVRNALTLLADLGDAGCLPAIVPRLHHPEPRVRRTAVRALWKLGGPVAEPHLLAMMKEADGETMQEILFALGQLRSEASLPQIMEFAQDKRVLERLRIQALDALGLIGSARAIPALLECLRRKSLFGGGEPPAIRLAAAKALASMPAPEAKAAFLRVIEGEPKGEEREAMRRLLDRPTQP